MTELEIISQIESLLKQLKELKGAKQVAPIEKFSVDFINNYKEWPLAVDSHMIVETEEDKQIRAEGIVRMFITLPMIGRNVLDFGCGEGHLVEALAGERAKSVLGYDTKAADRWMKANGSFTDNWDDAANQGPFDIITLFDVLDHADDPIEVLVKCKSVLSKNGVILCRNQPWCSRHGGHLYSKINKAYAHLFLTPDDLTGIDMSDMPKQKVLFPVFTYRKWISDAGLTIKSEDPKRVPVESFFKSDPIRQHIIKPWLESGNSDFKGPAQFPNVQLETQYVDYSIII